MYPNLPADVLKAKQLYDAALSCFNEVSERADGRFAVDAAIYSLNAAELRFRAAIQRDRSLFCPDALEKRSYGGSPSHG